MKSHKIKFEIFLYIVLLPGVLMARDYPEILCMSRWGTAMPTGIQDMVTSDPYAYVLGGTWDYNNRCSRLGIIDFTDITHPIDAGFIFLPVSRTEKLAIDDDLIAVTADSSMILVSRESPTTLVSHHPHVFQSKTLGVGLADGIAYVTLANSSLVIFDVSNPHQPRGIDIIELPCQADAITIQDDTMFLNGERLMIFDISHPDEPSLICSFDEYCLNVAQWQNYFYLACGDSGLTIVELQDGDNPQIVGHIEDRTMDVQVQDGKLFTVGRIRHIIDAPLEYDITEVCSYILNNPASPQYCEAARLCDDDCQGLKKFGDALITWTPQIQLIPELSPLQGGANYYLPRTTSQMLINEQAGFVCYGNTVVAYDLSDPYHPVGADTIDYSVHSVLPFKVRNNLLYTVSDGYFYLNNIDDLYNITEEEAIRSRSPNFLKADFSTYYLYTIYENMISCYRNWNGFELVDTLYVDAEPSDIAVLPENYIFIAANSEGILSFGFTEEHEILQIDQIDFPSDIESCAIKNDRLYACGDDVYIVDISDPSSLSWIGAVELPGVNSLIHINGNNAVISSRVGYREPDREFGFFLLDITNTDEPNIIGRYSTDLYHMMPMQVSLSNTFVCVRSRYDYSAYDVSELLDVPNNSTPYPSDNTLVASISPNPTNAAARVFFNLPKPGNINLTMFDPFGREVMKWSPSGVYPSGENSVSLDAAILPSGTYFMQLNSENRQSVSPLVIVK